MLGLVSSVGCGAGRRLRLVSGEFRVDEGAWETRVWKC